MTYRAVFFDLGRVVLDWVPALPFAQVLDAAEVPAFMKRVNFSEWNRQADHGRAYPDIEAEWCARFPEDAEAILAYRRFNELSIPGFVPGVWALVAELHQHSITVGALSNWSADTFPAIRQRFSALERFDTLVVSGFEGVAKPNPDIFALACERNQVTPEQAVFIDDMESNVAAARDFGLTAILFTDAATLRAELLALGLPVPGQAVTEPIYHLAVRQTWEQAAATGSYPLSARDRRFEAEGFVHFSFAGQLSGTRARFYGDLSDDELVLLRLNPEHATPVLVENGFPHLYAPLRPDQVAVLPVHDAE